MDKKKLVSSGNSYEAIDRYAEALMRHLHIPGLSLAVVEGDQVVYRRGPCRMCGRGAIVCYQ